MRVPATLILLLAGTGPVVAATGDWDFRVLLDGREIGRHRYTLEGEGQRRYLRSDATFDVRLLSISAFRYKHQALERWESGCLQSLDSRTRMNGKQVIVTASAREGRLMVERPSGRDEHEGCVMSFAYWDPRILEAERLLNSQTGELVPVQISAEGTDAVSVRGRKLAAERHRIQGPGLEIDLWYADGHWVALEALTDVGRRLRYELH